MDEVYFARLSRFSIIRNTFQNNQHTKETDEEEEILHDEILLDEDFLQLVKSDEENTAGQHGMN